MNQLTLFFIIVMSFSALCAIAAIVGIILEVRAYNKGICPRCKRPLEHLDEQESKGYGCTRSDYIDTERRMHNDGRFL